MNRAVLSFGSNIGHHDDKIRIITASFEMLKKRGIVADFISEFITTIAIVDQNIHYKSNAACADYINCIGVFNLLQGPFELLRIIKNIEVALGRQPDRQKWAEREIDIDIIYFNQISLHSAKLTIPHKMLPERDFVKILLSEHIKNEFAI